MVRDGARRRSVFCAKKRVAAIKIFATSNTHRDGGGYINKRSDFYGKFR
ncbi:MAG TPA: hypothetical protein IAB15_01470 [Candidatus Ornithoclostridium faecigallinarum]|nr:hypothetical protein [Candidatus Ornithoclostridium faecigallinarum]